MRALELKIPPPVVAALLAGAMWGISTVAPPVDVAPAVRTSAAAILVLVGLMFDAAGIYAFWRARTTINPLKPANTSSLVCSGVYRITRNPMYVGMLFLLTAWAVWLSCAWALPVLPLFVLYINRFQIAPEEKILAAKFGEEYADYQARVRRWL
jgi:protein-S-isoprenylcysteine O-methyltransferase Ste14